VRGTFDDNSLRLQSARVGIVGARKCHWVKAQHRMRRVKGMTCGCIHSLQVRRHTQVATCDMADVSDRRRVY
jgi:hypothetical protein